MAMSKCPTCNLSPPKFTIICKNVWNYVHHIIYAYLSQFMYVLAIREEIREIEEGKYEAKNNVLKVSCLCCV